MLGFEPVNLKDIQSPGRNRMQVQLCLLNAILTGNFQAQYDMLEFEPVRFKDLKSPVYLCLLNALFTSILQAQYDMLGAWIGPFNLKDLQLPGRIQVQLCLLNAILTGIFHAQFNI